MPYINAPDGSGTIFVSDPSVSYAQAAQDEANRTGATVSSGNGGYVMSNLAPASPRAQLSGNPSSPSGNGKTLTFQMPDGTRKTISVSQADVTGQASAELQQILQQGGLPVDPSTGQPMQAGPTVQGGTLWKSSQGLVPLNVMAGFGWLPGQQAAISELANTAPTTGSPSGPAGPPLNVYQPPPAQVAPPMGSGGTAGTGAAVTAPTQGGVGNFITPAGTPDPLTNLSPSSSWQTILNTLINAGLNKSSASNNLIDLATNQLTNAQNRTNAIDSQQGTVSSFIKSMIDQANQASTTRDTGIQTILQNVGKGGLLGNASSLLDTLQAGSSTGNAPGNVQFDPAVANIANNAVKSNQPLIDTATSQAGQNPLSLVDPKVQDTINKALQGASGFVNAYDPNNPYGASTPGLSPQAQAALRLNQTQVIPGQFNDALSGAYAELQRRGALGGELPGSQEDLMRTLAPIYAARGAAYSSANAQDILTNAQLQEQQRQQNANLASTGVGQLTGAAGQQISANQQAINQWLQTQGLGQTATQNNVNAGGLINSQDALAVQQLLSNRSNANSLINSMGGLIGTIGQTYDPSKSNSLASGGIADLISLINSGTSALQTGNEAVNSATAAYQAGNQPLATATSAGQTAANNSPGSFQNQLLAALLSTAGSNAGSIAGGLKTILGKIFGNSTTGNVTGSGPSQPTDGTDWLSLLGVPPGGYNAPGGGGGFPWPNQPGSPNDNGFPGSFNGVPYGG